jgi:hypothetical protein
MVGSAMPKTLARSMPATPRKPLAMGFAGPATAGESDRKNLAEPELRREFGAVLTRAFALADLSLKDVAFRLGHQDQSAVSRWVNGAEPTPIAKLWALTELRAPLVMALSEQATEIKVSLVAEWQRRRA